MIRSSTHSQQSPIKSHKRRNLLLLVGGSFAALSAWQWFRLSKKPESTALPGNTPITESEQSQFLALSKLLTSEQQLHPQTSIQIYTILRKNNPEFSRNADALFQFVHSHQFNDVEAIIHSLNDASGDATSNDSARLKDTLHQIVKAWYLGVVGEGAHSQVVSYASALMFGPVRDAIVIPSYCKAAFGYWAVQP